LHELSHAVDDKLNKLNLANIKTKKFTAEFSGAVIGFLMVIKYLWVMLRITSKVIALKN